MKTLVKTLALAAAALAASGCGGSPEVGDAVVDPSGASAPAEKPPETPVDKVDPATQPGEPPKTAPAEPAAPKAE